MGEDTEVDLGFSLEGDEDEVAKEDPATVLKRHRQEEQALRKEHKDKIFAIHKSKQAERKAAEDERDAAIQAMLERQAAEMAAAKGESVQSPDAAGMAALSVSSGPSQPGGKKKSKAQKKQDKERAQEQRMADVRAGAGPSQRDEELAQLAQQLTPSGLKVFEIPADGHCLYRSLAQQLQAHGVGYADEFAACRQEIADHMRKHASDFAPFLDEGVDLPSYCNVVESSAEWGGQLEITALAHARKRAICVYSATSPPLVTGEEYDGNGPRLLLAYHRHYYGLGAHYNAVVPL